VTIAPPPSVRCGSQWRITEKVPPRFTAITGEVVDCRRRRSVRVGAVEDAGRGDDAGDPSERARGVLDPAATEASSETSTRAASRARGVFDRVDGGARVGFVEVDDRDCGAPLRRELRGRAADPAPGAGDHTTEESSISRE